MASSDQGPGAPPPKSPARKHSSSGSRTLDQGDPTVRTALRYTLSPREYELLHQYLISRAPPTVRKRAPAPAKYPSHAAKNGEVGKSEAAGRAEEEEDFNAATVRVAMRLFSGTYAGLKGWEFLSNRMAKKPATPSYVPQALRLSSSNISNRTRSTGSSGENFRTASSFALVLLFHRLLHRFFTRLRASLLLPSAEPFRRRNPSVAAALTSRYTPAVGASLAGVWLALCPSPTPAPRRGNGGGSRASRFRASIAIYAAFKAAEWGWEACVKKGYITRAKPKGEFDEEEDEEQQTKEKGSLLQLPSWMGSWMLMPAIYAQLLHAFVFDRDCFPEAYGGFIMGHSPEYVHPRPEGFPSNLEWPGTYDMVDALAEMAQMGWP
jgi:hypothetical protein